MLVFKAFGIYSSVIRIKLCKIILHKCKICCLSNLASIVPALHKVMFVLTTVSDLMTPLFFSFFLEKNMFVFFLNILRQKSGRYVCVQLLQTLNILFENISHETSLCKDMLLNCWGFNGHNLIECFQFLLLHRGATWIPNNIFNWKRLKIQCDLTPKYFFNVNFQLFGTTKTLI